MSDKTEKKDIWDDPAIKEAHEHLKAARASVHKSMEALVPAGFLENRRKAKKEVLLAVRTLIDSAIDKIEKPAE